MSTRLETIRLVIRTFEFHNADAWITMFNDPEVTRFLSGATPTMETFQRAIARRHAMERDGGYAMWAVDERDRRVRGLKGLKKYISEPDWWRAPHRSSGA